MSNSNSRLSHYKENQIKQRQGIVDYLPFAIPRLQSYIPGLIPGVMYKITSHTGNGKTQFSKFIMFSSIIGMLKKKRKLTVIYVALEESREEFIDSVYLFVVNVMLKVPLQYYDLHGYSNRALSEVQLLALNKASELVDQMMDTIELITDTYDSQGVFNKCKAVANRYGNVDVFDDFTVREEESDRLFLLVVDHISLLKDKGTSVFETMANWHTDIAKRTISKKWKWIVVHVQQQNLDSDKAQYTSAGKQIIDKVIPSLDGLGDNRTISRDDYVVIGLFAPARYRVDEFGDYIVNARSPEDMYAIGDNLRILYILKNRLGTPNKTLPLYFDGSCSYFCELPISREPSVVAGFLDSISEKFNKSNIIR